MISFLLKLTPAQRAWLDSQAPKSVSRFIRDTIRAMYPDFPHDTNQWGGERQTNEDKTMENKMIKYINNVERLFNELPENVQLAFEEYWRETVFNAMPSDTPANRDLRQEMETFLADERIYPLQYAKTWASVMIGNDESRLHLRRGYIERINESMLRDMNRIYSNSNMDWSGFVITDNPNNSINRYMKAITATE